MNQELLDPRRQVQADGASNLRDLGGFTTRDGKCTQWRRFLRSASPNRLTAQGQQTLLDYGLGAVVDLRSAKDLVTSPNVLEGHQAIRFHHHDFWGDRVRDFSPQATSLDQVTMLADLFGAGIDRCGGVIADTMRTMIEEDGHGVLFHCGAGKDRTGIIAALLLSVAGVPSEVIAAEYALTAKYLDEPFRNHAADPLTVPEGTNLPVYFYSCLPESMQLALEYLDSQYSGADGYLRLNGLAANEIARLRSRLLD